MIIKTKHAAYADAKTDPDTWHQYKDENDVVHHVIYNRIGHCVHVGSTTGITPADAHWFDKPDDDFSFRVWDT